MGFISYAQKYPVSTFHPKNPALQDSIFVFNQDCELVSQLPSNCKRIALIFPFILLIKSDNLLRQSISRNQNLAASLTRKIHGLSHNAMAELLEDYNIFFLNILKFYFIIHFLSMESNYFYLTVS